MNVGKIVKKSMKGVVCLGISQNRGGFYPPPNHPMFNRVFPDFHHPFWDTPTVYGQKSGQLSWVAHPPVKLLHSDLPVYGAPTKNVFFKS